MCADDVDQTKVALANEDLFVFMAGFGEQIAVGIANERAAPDLPDGLGGGRRLHDREPFGFERFSLDGADRGFKLTSKLNYQWNNALIFVETAGTPFYLDGPNIGKPIPPEK